MNKELEIIENQDDKEMMTAVSSFLEKAAKGMSPIQIENFVLNDVEYPTDYGKFVQARFELASRFNQVIDAYYEIKEKEIQIEMKEREISNEKDDLRIKLLQLQKEKMEVQLEGMKNNLKKILSEARIFYEVYKKHPDFHDLTPEKEFELEAENWAKKTINMPTIFEERYGRDYMIKALGEENYKRYLEVRRQGFGLLPREIFEVKQLKADNTKQLTE